MFAPLFCYCSCPSVICAEKSRGCDRDNMKKANLQK